MKNLISAQIRTIDRNSSKGNQLKWYDENKWYKADYTGYEGFAEYIVSHLLEQSNAADCAPCVMYDTEKIMYENRTFSGCCSDSFLPDHWEIVTAEHLFRNVLGMELYKEILKYETIADRIRFTVDTIIRITGLKDFGKYLTMILEFDGFFLNEDRHTNNIAVLRDPDGNFHYCPFFDNGAALLSDTTLDYPLNEDLYTLLKSVKSKPFSSDFDDQIEAAETLYGKQLHFSFNTAYMNQIVDADRIYAEEIHQRVKDILHEQMRRYPYFW